MEFRVTDGDKFRLKDVDPGDTLKMGDEDKPRAKELLAPLHAIPRKVREHIHPRGVRPSAPGNRQRLMRRHSSR